MMTRGCLDVDRESRAVTSFVCTNTVVNENEGNQHIELMQKKFTVPVKNNEGPTTQKIEDDTVDAIEQNKDEPASIKDPRRLEQVSLHVETNLPSPSPQDSEGETFAAACPESKSMSPLRLTIFLPNKEIITSSSEKIYAVAETVQRDPNQEENNYKQSSTAGSSHTTPQYIHPVEMNSIPAPREVKIVRQNEPVTVYVKTATTSCLNSYVYVQAPSKYFVPPITYNYYDFGYNTDDIINALASPNMDYFDASQSPFSNLISDIENFDQNDEIFNDNQVADRQDFEYRGAESEMNMPMPQHPEESNVNQALPQASSSNIFNLRANDFEYLDLITKKKTTATEFIGKNASTSYFQSVCLNEPISDSDLGLENNSLSDLESPMDYFSNETIFDGDQIESALSGCTMEPIDLSLTVLSGTEVKEILDQI